MSITYDYKIISVDVAARCMEVVYSAEGHSTLHVSTRLPYEGEALEVVIQMFAPVPYWIERGLKVVAPEIGTVGFITPHPPPVSVEVSNRAAPNLPVGNIPVSVL